MKTKRVLAFLLSGVLTISLFAGCGKKTPNYLSVDGDKSYNEMFETYLRAQLSMMTQNADADQIREYLKQEVNDDNDHGHTHTYADILKEYAVSYVKNFAAVKKLAKENDISLTADEKKQLKEQKDQVIEQQGGRSKFVAQLKEQSLSEELYDALQENSMLQSKILNALFNQGGKFAMSEDEVISDVTSNYARVRHILVQASESDTDFAEKQQKANTILARVTTGGEDFETVLKEVGEDPGMTKEAYTDGYVFNQNGNLVDSPSTTFDSTFVSESFKLKDNQISGVVKSTSGLHIIKRLPLDAAFVKQHLSDYYTTYAQNAYSQKLQELADTLSVDTTEAYDTLDVSTLIQTANTSSASGSSYSGSTSGSTSGSAQSSGSASSSAQSSGSASSSAQ